jgi:hypothetical protein
LVCGIPFKTVWAGPFPILSVIGFVVMFGGVILAIIGPRLSGRGERTGSSAGARQRRRKGAGGSFTSRMEDRFRRRFEQ